MLRLFALASLVLAAPAAAQTQFTYAQLKDLDTAAVARLLLGASGDRMVEHRIVTDQGSFGGPATNTIRWVGFAQAPEYRLDDTCEAGMVELEFRPSKYTRDHDLPVHVSKLEVSKRWGILPRGVKDCAALGPVIDGWPTPSPYFSAKSTYGTDLYGSAVGPAVAMLRAFLADPQSAGPLRCKIDFDAPDERQAACDQRRIDAVIDPKLVNRLEVGECGKLRPSVGDAPMCVSFRFDDISEQHGSGSYLLVTFVTDLPAGAALTGAAKIVRTSISKVTWVA